MAEGLYRIGECIFMEVNPPPTPYQICKVEELRKNSKGSVEVAAKCFYRRKDLPSHLLLAADRHAMAVEEENEMDATIPRANNYHKLTDLQKHQIKHRELFLSRQIDTYKIDMVRGKCSVSFLNELEDISSYMEKEDTFFYTMVYDPNQKTLLVDKGEIRVGGDYQAVVPPYIPPRPGSEKKLVHPGDQLWEPNKMADNKVEQFLVVSRSIGTFARALLDGSKKPQISLRLGAAAASRDITLFHAMDVLHQSSYDINAATGKLVPRGPVLCADELEAWSQEEAKRFEEGLQDEKNFLYIQRRYLPWKPLKSIIAYYYMWKTTDRYQIQKRHRMIEKQNDLKEVIVHIRTPSGAPPSGPRDLTGKAASAGELNLTIPPENTPIPLASDGEKGCESCRITVSTRWVSWGPAHDHCRLCGHCYVYWRKYGGLKLPSRWEIVECDASTAGDIVAPLIEKKPLKERQDKANKKGIRGKDDLTCIPHLPFNMIPSATVLYTREKVGRTLLRKAARVSNFLISPPHSVVTPSDKELQEAIVKHKKRQRCQIDKKLDRVRKALSSPPKQIRLHNSPMPISPSYRAKQAPRLSCKPTGGSGASSTISTSGTYVPPKPPPGSPPLLATAVSAGSYGNNVVPVGRKREPPELEDMRSAKIPKSMDASGLVYNEVFFKGCQAGSWKEEDKEIGSSVNQNYS
ncbi:PREDICTED: metastasis-associated protein MTA3-like isoform X2 [Amphimedon queenslandica]|uniref:Metastasis-associated protein MTA3 n=1 Tax=Amphimedon queenslandica TaxID=400682 RepID=A0AAN0K4Y7_AMPQE|nr:PREDICTED: metastasis-associated protein MTA3-like isoform X2 [Amphimedon queenslandica]|eukprot:XP_019864285.1 PREDICTED: metastasis-associated protein MTA3-like isoform X2 [Amphimedon queenslandica]